MSRPSTPLSQRERDGTESPGLQVTCGGEAKTCFKDQLVQCELLWPIPHRKSTRSLHNATTNLQVPTSKACMLYLNSKHEPKKAIRRTSKMPCKPSSGCKVINLWTCQRTSAQVNKSWNQTLVPPSQSPTKEQKIPTSTFNCTLYPRLLLPWM